MSKQEEKPSALKREHPALKKMKFINFFLCLWVIFALLDRSGYGSRDPIESGSGFGSTGSQHWSSYFVEAQNASIVNKRRSQEGINMWASFKLFCELFFSHRATILSEEMNLVDDDERDVTDKVPGLPGARHTVPLLWRGDDNAGSGDGPKREIRNNIKHQNEANMREIMLRIRDILVRVRLLVFLSVTSR